MANKKISYTLELDAEIGDLESKIAKAKTALSGIMGSGAAPKELQTLLDKLDASLGRIRDKTKDPIVSKSGFTSVQKDISSVSQSFNGLVRIIDDLMNNTEGHFNLLPKDEKDKILAVASAVAAFQKGIEEATTETKELKKAQEELAQAAQKVQTAETTKQSRDDSLETAKQKRDLLQEQVDAIKARQKALKEAKAEQVKVEAFYAKPDENGNKRDRRKKYDGVSSTPAKAKAKVDSLSAQVEEDEKALGGLNEQLKIAKHNVDSYTAKLSTAIRQLEEAQAACTEAEKNVAALNATFQQDSEKNKQKAFEDLRKKAEELGIELDKIDETYSQKESDELISRFEALRKKGLDAVANQGKEAIEVLEDVGDTTKRMGDKAEAAQEDYEDLGEAMKQQEAFEGKIKQFLGLSGAAQLMRSALRDAMQTITELDATMTEMAVVTDLTVGDYWDQLPQYSQQASDLGVSINSAYKAATLYYQQGLKGNEVTKISAETLKLAKIAGIDAADATNKMTAALRGFNMELNETSAQRVADVYAELAAITAADVDEISNAMTKTASIASSAGMEFETTAAFLSQIIETTRESAETAGTALKTVIARFQELKKDPSEIGEVDGEIVDANKIETALRSVGVALRDSSGQFRDLDDVFMDLSKKWDGLDKNTQRYIATIAAGSRQQSRFIAMMSDYGRTQELVTAANTSAGASNKQFQKTMESLEAKVEKLKNAWHEFTMGIMDSDLVKFGVDFLTKFLEIINKATSAFDGMGGSIMKIISIFGIFKLGSKIFGMIKAPLMSFFMDVVKMAGEKGEESGQAFKKGAEKGAQKSSSGTVTFNGTKATLPEGYSLYKDGRMHKDGKYVSNTERDLILRENKQTLGSTAKGKFEQTKQGAKNLFSKNGSVKQAKSALADEIQKGGTKKERDAKYSAALDKYSEAKKGGDASEIAKAKKEADEARKSVEAYGEAENKVKTESQKAWGDIGAGMTAAGQAATSIGMGISMIGGLMSSLGLEEAGKALSTIGTVITFIGTALMAIPPILTAITAHPIIALITLIVAVILGTIIAIMSYIDSISAEAKLADAQKNAEAAKEAAEQADQAFQDLKDSLSELNDKQDTLENLREGTEEWNKAVQDVNSSVLDLIDKYPELAGLVENEGGVLKLDVESDEVQDVIKKYESSAALAKSVQYSADAKVTAAQQQYDFSKLDAVNDVSKHRGWNAFGKSVQIGAQVGVATSGGNPLLAVGNALAGAITGATVGAIVGPIENAKTHTDKELQKATEALALSVQEGATDMDFQSMRDFLISQGVAADEAEIMADSFADNTDSLLEFGEATQASKAALDAQYSAMAMQAKQMINLGKYTAEEQEQMSNAIGSEQMQEFEQQRAKELEKEYQNKSNTEEFDQMKSDYAKEIYGAGARVDGNKILDEKGEVLREFENEDEFAAAMASAQATKDAANAMEKIPGIINISAKRFEEKVAGAGQAFEKLFLGKDGSELTSGDITALSNAIQQGALGDAWDDMSQEERDVYGDDYSKYVEEVTDRLQKARTSFDATNKTLAKFNKNIKLNDKLSAEAAKAYVKNLQVMDTGGATAADLEGYNAELDAILSGLTAEQANQVMAQINAIDISDSKAWDNLKYTFQDMGIMANMNSEALQRFVDAGKLAANAIYKINFESLANDINNTYKLIDKIKEGGRIYNESDYKELVAANRSLESQFTQIGDEFIYVGGSMEDLREALEENTVAKLQEANRQLKSRSEMSAIIQAETESQGFTSTTYMDEEQRMEYLNHMRNVLVSQGKNLEDFGIAGLGSMTDFSTATAEQLKEWAEAIAAEGAKQATYEEDYAKQLRAANVQRYTYNDASFNAQNAYQKNENGEWDEYASQHQDALILQAIQSGAVSNSMIEAYKQAIEDGDADQVRTLGEQISTATEKIVEASEGRDAYKELVDRVTSAIQENRQAEIDKLSEVNETIQAGNDKLITKIQEQINEDRQTRANAQTEQDIADLQAQQTYLGMDTSGMNALQMRDLDQQIQEAEQNYQDTLVDQAIQNLTDANAEAAEQRQEQIDLMQSQLDWQIENGELTREAEGIVEEGLNEIAAGVDPLNTTMGRLLWGVDGKGLGTLAQEDWVKDLQLSSIMAADWYESQGMNRDNATGDLGTGVNPELDAAGAQRQAARDTAVLDARKLVDSKNAAGQGIGENFENTSEYKNARQAYIDAREANVSEEEAGKEFDEKIRGAVDTKIVSGTLSGVTASGINPNGGFSGSYDEIEISMGGKTYTVQIGHNTSGGIMSGTDTQAATSAEKDKIEAIAGKSPYNGKIAMLDKVPYIYIGGDRKNWYSLLAYGKDDGKNFSEEYLSRLRKYKQGGSVDFTGPAWLDGTKSRPEYILDADQTERFFSLVDILEGFDGKGGATEKTGDNYFDIKINVDKLENDYDVEQMANKIRRMIYEDATYRNVNAINLIR